MHLERHHLVLGGARSGKTRRALEIAEQKSSRVYIATAEAFDDEMAARIARHKAERGPGWSTIEAPLELATAIGDLSRDAERIAQSDDTVIVVDCLTLWLSNLMLAERDVENETQALIDALGACPIPSVLVSNEVGWGIVPTSQLGRAFRDRQGQLNQALAGVVGAVELVVAGLPMTLK
ncbi:MAG: bifunctional adenosylcobinamide kinase/adenosylcobinamide-phosphate guanylyltransferase [Pseudomonadota bacterium]